MTKAMRVKMNTKKKKIRLKVCLRIISLFLFKSPLRHQCSQHHQFASFEVYFYQHKMQDRLIQVLYSGGDFTDTVSKVYVRTCNKQTEQHSTNLISDIIYKLDYFICPLRCLQKGYQEVTKAISVHTSHNIYQKTMCCLLMNHEQLWYGRFTN